jgi:hypothetical protein
MNIDTLDKAFLRLVTDFSVAKGEMMVSSQYIDKDTIVISPTNKFLQISNSLTSIAFDDSYIVELVDCTDNAMLDITNKIYINEFQDINGIYQIAFEIAPIQTDFYNENLFIRFKHTGSDLTLWSNPILLTDNVQTIRLDYKNYSYYQGTDYSRANYYQSIEIKAFYNLPSTKENTKITTLTNGNIRRSRTTQALEYSYTIESIDTFTIDRLMVALNSDVVYLNGVRFKVSENVQSDERQGMTNQFSSTFKGQFEANDTYIADYQIAPPFVGVYNPLGNYALSALPIEAQAGFNYALQSVINVQLYFNNSLLVNIIPEVLNNTFSFDLPTLEIGEYYVLFQATSVLGQTFTANSNTWAFVISEGEFDRTEFDNIEFLVN